MPDDAQTPPPDRQLVQWLRALADVVESDPALAARVTQGLTPPPAETEADTGQPLLAADVPAGEVPSPEQIAEPSHPTTPSAEPPGEHTPPIIAPTLRHTRKASRFGPSVSGRPAELGTGVPDPFAVFAQGGEEGLRRALGELRVGTLRAIIRAHDLDPAGKVAPSATEKRLIAAIIAAVSARGATAPPPKKRAPARRNRPTAEPQ